MKERKKERNLKVEKGREEKRREENRERDSLKHSYKYLKSMF